MSIFQRNSEEEIEKEIENNKGKNGFFVGFVLALSLVEVFRYFF